MEKLKEQEKVAICKADAWEGFAKSCICNLENYNNIVKKAQTDYKVFIIKITILTL
jgi:hypothetical protein